MVTWFAALFYLPRLFVYHTDTRDRDGIERFKTMERKLFYGIMTPGGIVTIVLGAWLMFLHGEKWISSTPWFQVKLALIAVLVGYHFYLGYLLRLFQRGTNRHGHVYYRWINEFPVLILIGAVLLAVIKPEIW